MNLIDIFSLCLCTLPHSKPECFYQEIAVVCNNSLFADSELTPLDSLNGEIKRFYKSGKLKEVALYEKGLRNGITITYNPNGSLNYEATYKAGKLNGLYKHYDKGLLVKQINYSDGFYNGEWIAYRKGHKTIEAQFAMGRLNGWYYDYYFKSGRIQRKAFYRDGGIVSGEFLYGEDGCLKYEMICNHSDTTPNHLVMQVFYDKQGNTTGRKKIDQYPITKYLFGL
ncbi:hypothetical protein GCM10027594_18950 [Hymenobacter agri]